MACGDDFVHEFVGFESTKTKGGKRYKNSFLSGNDFVMTGAYPEVSRELRRAEEKRQSRLKKRGRAPFGFQYVR